MQQLAEHGAVRTVHRFLQSSFATDNKNDRAVVVQIAAVSTLRSLAIQDDVVQSMVAEGVLDTACRLLLAAAAAFNIIRSIGTAAATAGSGHRRPGLAPQPGSQ